ncbi:MAG TPA: hypothetical protein VNW92_11940, partial [Polyangiaceae bacterium]|nr:hypothetical protein [Polyangiaceae bacterium]
RARLSSLTINVPAALQGLSSLRVTSNGLELARATWGRPMPNDGGNYAIQISAAGRTYWSTQVLLAAERDQRVLDVPLLPEPEPAASPASASRAAPAKPRAAAPERRYWTTPRTVGWSVIGAGAATSVASLYFALSAKSAERDVENTLRSEENQPGPPSARTPWDSAGHARELEGERAQALAQGFGFASGALLIGGAALVIFGSDKSELAPAVSMELAPGLAKIEYAKRF